ncbi:hypothetical protein Tco_1220335 [Tanacetum coccineum]
MVGNFHMYANVARFNRDTKASPPLNAPKPSLNATRPSFANVVKDNRNQANHDVPVMVLEPNYLNHEGNQHSAFLIAPWRIKLVVVMILENKLESLKLLENNLESMKILRNELESLKSRRQTRSSFHKKNYIRKCLREAVKEYS